MRNISRLFSSSKRVTHSFRYVILGAGDGAGSLSALLNKNNIPSTYHTLIIGPEQTYTFQPGQTKVGVGFLEEQQLKFPNKFRLPRWVQTLDDRAKLVLPEENLVELGSGNFVQYQELIIATGTQVRFHLTKGLQEALDDPTCPVGSVYTCQYATKYSKLRQNFSGGRALFSQPKTPVKCLGANQKVMYVSAEYWAGKKKEIEFHTGGDRMIGPEYYHQKLLKIAEGYKVNVNFLSELVEVRGKEKIAVFQQKDGLVEKKFDLLHAVPLHRPQEFIAESGLAAPTGYVDVDIQTLQHKKHKNIWALGDCAELPTSKTLSAVSSQIHVVANNLKAKSEGKPINTLYDGYTACPVITDKRRTLFCEFGYNTKMLPTFVKEPNPSILAGLIYKYLFRWSSFLGLNHYVQPARIFYRENPIFRIKDKVKGLVKKDKGASDNNKK